MTALHLTLLGGFTLKTDANVPVALTARKSRALLAYLALHPGQAIPRDRLAGLLWDGVPESQARTNLRQALTSIRRAIPQTEEPIIVADAESVMLDAAQVTTDVVLFEKRAAANSDEDPETLMDLYQGDFLDGLNAKARPFEEWMTSERYRLRERALEVMDDRLRASIASGADSQAISLAMRILIQDPLREDIHRTLMQLYAKIGRSGAALRQYRTCQDILREELGVAPDPDTQALFDRISSARRSRPAKPHEGFPSRPTAPALPGEEADEGLDGKPETKSEMKSGAAPTPLQELRFVTIVHIDLADVFERASELDPEDFSRKINEIYARLEAIIGEHGGKIFSIAGSLVMSVFGAARIRSDDAHRAVHAAFAVQQDMQEGLDEAGAQIGVATGQVLISQMFIGGQEQVSVTGRSVGLASRLATESVPGTIWLSDNTMQQVGDHLEATEFRPDWLSEYRQTRVWLARKIYMDPGRATSLFVGRRMELGLFANILDNLKEEGLARFVLVRGDAGIGKSCLVEEILTIARTADLVTHKATFFDFGQKASVDTVQRFLETLVEAETDDLKDRQTAVDRLVASDIVPESHRLFVNDMLAIPHTSGEAERFAAMTTRERDVGKSDVLDRLLEYRTREAPLVGVLEDLHWASPKTMIQLAALCQVFARHRVLLIMTTRPESDPVDAKWRAAAGNCPLTTIDLPPLSRAEALELTGHYNKIDPAYVEACIERAAGNPLFLDQLLRAENENEQDLPSTVQSVILSQVDTLETGDRQALQAAAVLGQQFELEPLRVLLNDRTYEPDRLVQRTLVQNQSGHLMFAHALIHDAVLSTLLKSARKALHKKAADWFASDDPWQQATHLELAGDPGAAMAWLAAATAETARFNPGRALELIERGLTLTENPAEMSALHASYGENLRQIGQTKRSVSAFETALEQASNNEARCVALIGLATSLRILDRLEEALSFLVEAEALVDETDHDTLASVYFMKGNIYFPLGDLDACLAAHQTSHSHARKTENVRLEIQAIGGMADAYYQRGQMRTAFEHFERCLTLAREKGYRRLQSTNMSGFSRYFLLESDAAFEATLDTVRLSKEIFSQRAEAIAVSVLPIMYTYAGEFDTARRYAEYYLDLATAMGSQRLAREGLFQLALVRASSGQRESGARELKELYDTFEKADQTYIGPWLLGALAIFATDRNEKSWALEEGERLLQSGCLGHCYLYFYQQAIEAGIAEEDWTSVEKYSAALEAWTAAEPLPWADFFIARGRALSATAIASDGDRPELKERLTLLRDRATAARLDLAVSKIDEALSAL